VTDVHDNRRLCSDCRHFMPPRCTSKDGLWAHAQIALDVRKVPLRCDGFVAIGKVAPK